MWRGKDKASKQGRRSITRPQKVHGDANEAGKLWQGQSNTTKARLEGGNGEVRLRQGQ